MSRRKIFKFNVLVFIVFLGIFLKFIKVKNCIKFIFKIYFNIIYFKVFKILIFLILFKNYIFFFKGFFNLIKLLI